MEFSAAADCEACNFISQTTVFGFAMKMNSSCVGYPVNDDTLLIMMCFMVAGSCVLC